MGLATAGLRLVVNAASAVRGLMRVRTNVQITKEATQALQETFERETAAFKANIHQHSTLAGLMQATQATSKHYNISLKDGIKLQQLRAAQARVEISQRQTAVAVARTELRAKQQEIHRMRAEQAERMILSRQIGTAVRTLRELRLTVMAANRVFHFFGSNAPQHVHRVTHAVKGLQQHTRTASIHIAEGFHLIQDSLAHLTGAHGVHGIGEMIKGSIELAGHMESTRVTFDTLLGDSKKSDELLGRLRKFASESPFNQQDVIEGSKRLLLITKDNVEANEELVKMAGNLTALTGGQRKIDEASWAIVAAAISGEFENLKSFGLVLRQDMFENAGEKGGEAYANAVLDEIALQFEERTGGRGGDLLEKLSRTLLGKASNVLDNMNILGEMVGEKLVESLGLKDVLDSVTSTLVGIQTVFRFMMDPFGEVTAKEINELEPEVRDLGMALFEGIDRAGTAVTGVMTVIKEAIGAYRQMDTSVRDAILIALAGAGATAAGFGLVVPIILTVATAAAALATVLSPAALVAGALGLQLALGAVMAVVFPLTAAVGLMAAGFMLFRREGESVGETLRRMGQMGLDLIKAVWEPTKAFFVSFGTTLLPILKKQGGEIAAAFQEMRAVIMEFLAHLSGHSVTSVEDWADAGKSLAETVGSIAEFFKDATVMAIGFFKWGMEMGRPLFKHMASDILNMGKAFFGLVTGTKDSWSALKTFGAGLMDIMTNPIRLAIDAALGLVQDAIAAIEAKIRPFNETIASQLRGAIGAVESARNVVKEGFLATDFGPPSLTSVIDLTINNRQDIDGEKVAESQTKTQLRRRHSGRGGDPVNPQELGFVINSEGTTIRSVGLDSLDFLE